MAERRAVPVAVFTAHAWHLAKLLRHHSPHLLAPPPNKRSRLLTQNRRAVFEREVASHVQNFVEDLIRDVWSDPTHKCLHDTQFYINKYQGDALVRHAKDILRQLLRSMDARQDDGDLTRRDLREAAVLLTDILRHLRTERLHEQPGAVYNQQITQLGLQAQQHGWDRFAFEEQLRDVYPYELFFELTQQEREQQGDRIDWEFDWVQNQLDVRWVANEFMEPMDVTEDDV